MVVEQKQWSPELGWTIVREGAIQDTAQLVLAFGDKELISDQSRFDELRKDYPNADIVFVSSNGEFLNEKTCEQCIVTSAFYFEKTRVQVIQVNLNEVKDSFDAGMHISASLDKDELCSLMLFSDGTLVNGSHLITGIHFNLSEIVPVTGGLASSRDDQVAVCGLNQVPKAGNIIGIALHGEYLKVGHACKSGWSAFGPERLITQANDNELFEIDDKPIIEVYQQYLDGNIDEEDKKILYPLGIKYADTEDRILRGVINIDTENNKILFGGEMPVDARVRLMKSNKFDLLDSAAAAATGSMSHFDISHPDFAVVISNHARKTILADWSDDEIEAARDVLGKDVPIMGFYSNAEISPMGPLLRGELQNQSLMITTFKEI